VALINAGGKQKAAAAMSMHRVSEHREEDEDDGPEGPSKHHFT
jgi:hypothetical protein